MDLLYIYYNFNPHYDYVYNYHFYHINLYDYSFNHISINNVCLVFHFYHDNFSFRVKLRIYSSKRYNFDDNSDLSIYHFFINSVVDEYTNHK
ncbi:hypothetical protein HDU79_003223 [Rhizoclosmatium sp. JEL0117]|nr:hypothetical protein HDU79_003223 [Rhizoclosmatium sp. JEL0117]